MPQNTLEIVLRLQLQQAERDQKKVDTLMRNIERSATRAGASVERGMGQAERGTRGFIRSAVDLQAVLQATEHIAQQFGNSLREAASGTAIQQSFRNLAKASGVSADALIDNMKRASKGTVPELDLIRISNRAMLAGGKEFAEDLPRLFEIARAASIATGQDIGFVFDTLTRGIAKASPLLIDNAEIYIKLGQAVEEWAKSEGKAVEELTMQERQLATRNAVLLQGAKLVKQVGSDTEAATDQFDQLDSTLKDATQSGLSFTNDVLGPMAPALKTAGDLAGNLLPSLILFKALGGSIGGAGVGAAVVGGGKALLTAGGYALAFAGGALAADKAIHTLFPSFFSLGEQLQILQVYFKDGQLAAQQFAAELEGEVHWSVKAAESEGFHAERLQRVIEEAYGAEDAFWQYLNAVRDVNSELEEGEPAVRLLTKAQFDFAEQMSDTNEELAEFVRLMVEAQNLEAPAFMTGAVLGFSASMGDGEDAGTSGRLLEEEDALKAVIDGLRGAGLETDELKAAEDKLRIALGDATAEAVAQENALGIMAQLAALGVISYERLAEAITEGGAAVMELAEAERLLSIATAESSSNAIELYQNRSKQKIVTRELAQAERDLAAALQESITELRDSAASDRIAAAAQRNQRLQQLAQQHAARMEDIERRYRRRIQDIERNYSRTVAKAAEERDAEAIYDARIAREDQLRDAEQDRGDALHSESRSYGDSIQAARDAYDQRIREINIRLQEEIQNERDAHKQELDDLRKFYSDQLRELKEANRLLEAEEWRHQRELVRAHTWGRNARTGGTGGSGRHTPMQHGGSGVVTGPASFFVEPGVREAYWFSGAMSGATQPAQGGFAMQPAVQGVQVGGNVNVNASGLPERISAMVTEQVAQTVIDGIASAFEAAL